MEPTAAPAATAAERISEEYKLDVDHRKPQEGKGKLGSLTNPEVYENVPGHLIPAIEREFDDFDTEAGSFLRGEQSEEQFIGFRLKQGVYGQRQPDVQMIRVKLPMGGITPDQLDAFGSVIEKYAPLGKGHVTTRQNIQIHHVPLPDAAKLIRELSDAGLSSREGCGNTVRNVTGDPYAGTSEGELFDITPYAAAYVRYFVRHPTTQLMPRKVKTAFTATDEDVAITGIHDIGFIPRERDGVRGVEIRVGGGTSIMPRVAPDPLRLRRARERRLPEGLRGRLPDLRPPGVAAREPRPRPDQGADRQGRHRRLPRDGGGGARGRLGRRARLLDRPPRLRDRRGGQRPRPADRADEPERRPLGVRPLPRGERPPAAPVRLQRGRDQDHPRRPHPRAAARPGADHARVHGRLGAHDRASELRPALGPRRGPLRRLASPRRARPERRWRRRGHRRRLLPGHRLAASSGSPARWA